MSGCYCLFCLTSNRGSLLGSYPGEMEMTGSRHGSHPLRSDRLEDPMPKMRRMDDDRPVMRRLSPDYDRRPNYMEEEQDRFRSDQRTGPMMGRMPEERDERRRNVVSIFDIDDRLRREDVEVRGPMGGSRNSLGGVGAERFSGRRDEDEEMLAMQRGRPLLRGSAEPRMGGSWNDNRASEREQPMSYDRRMQEDRRMPPANRPIPSLLNTMDRGSHEFVPDRRQQRMDPAMMRDHGPKHPGRDRPGPSRQDDFKQSSYYQNEPGNRASSAEHGQSFGRDRDDRNSWKSERSDHFGKFESEGTQSTQRQSNQPQQSSEQSDPVSLLLNLSQLLA